LLTEANGVPLAVAVDGANRNDFKLARETIDDIVIDRPKPTRREPQGLCLDKGYDYDEVRELAEEFLFTAPIRARGEEAKALNKRAGMKARRWVVERSHSWMNRFRRILIQLGEARGYVHRDGPSRLCPHHVESVRPADVTCRERGRGRGR